MQDLSATGIKNVIRDIRRKRAGLGKQLKSALKETGLYGIGTAALFGLAAMPFSPVVHAGLLLGGIFTGLKSYLGALDGLKHVVTDKTLGRLEKQVASRSVKTNKRKHGKAYNTAVMLWGTGAGLTSIIGLGVSAIFFPPAVPVALAATAAVTSINTYLLGRDQSYAFVRDKLHDEEEKENSEKAKQATAVPAAQLASTAPAPTAALNAAAPKAAANDDKADVRKPATAVPPKAKP
ncbi:MAG: hypothetical protein OXT65_00640 [Alphaproteobacteria bacterium]|nr:hypothetical protein [Alphaproteobacteria bacterium]